MCTVTFIPRQRGYLLGMNRDEKRTRAIGLLPTSRDVDGRRAICPSEPTGGTWIALNDSGVTLALINWYSIPASTSRATMSRGEIIPSMCASQSAEIIKRLLATLPLGRISPFRLIGVFPTGREIGEWQWDRKQLTTKSHRWQGQQWISSAFDEPTVQKVRSRTFQDFQNQASADTTDWLRRLHRSHLPESGPFSTCMHRSDAVTVSYTEVSVNHDRAAMRHNRGSPCDGSDFSSQDLRLTLSNDR